MKIMKRLAILIAILAVQSAWAEENAGSVDQQALEAACIFALDSLTAHFTTAGGSSNVTVTTSGTNCAWTAISYSPFVIVTSGASGTGDGVVTYTALNNTNLVGFTTVVVIAGQRYLVVQDAFSVPRGKYNGVFVDTNAPAHATSGSMNLDLNEWGTFTASVTLGTTRSSFKGQFDGAGNSTNVISRKNLDPLQVIMQLDVLEGANNITGAISAGVVTSALAGVVASSDRTNHCPFEGQYTVVLAPADSSDPTVPQGYGYGTLTVKKSGKATLKGALADGTKLSVSIPASREGYWPLYQLLYKKQGSCVGMVALSTNSAFDATVDWFKPPVATDVFYPAGFTTALELSGAKFVSPSAGGPSIAGSGTLTLGGGNLPGAIVKSVLIGTNGVVTVSPSGADNVQLGVDPSTSQFSGSFFDTGIGQTFKFTGMLVRTNNFGAGFFLETNRTGFVTIELTP